MNSPDYIEAFPNPEFLVKSISEQGYTLETALADLIDNSISAEANKVEILTENKDDNISVFITDNGIGMSSKELFENMQLPSKDMDSSRDSKDLGRFGLGLKTASFSQTRKFTVISKKKGEEKYSALTWDVEHLKKTSKWQIIINTETEITELLSRYNATSTQHLEQFEDYSPSTIIVWEGLKNFKNYLKKDNQFKHLKEQLESVTNEYLSIVFHKFMEVDNFPLKIRLDHILVKPFNPFSSRFGESARSLKHQEMRLGVDILKMDGFVLPVTASDNSSEWTTENKNLLDMEGLYIYRGDRIIFFGGWNGIIKKEPKLKLARLRIKVGNMNDDKLQLNVAKSKISIPYELKMGVLRYIVELKNEAKKEYNNRGLKVSKKNNINNETNKGLLEKQITTKGPVYFINDDYPLIKLIRDDLSEVSLKYFKVLLRGINGVLNKQRYTDDSYVEIIEKGLELKDIIVTTKKLLEIGMSKDAIFDVLLKENGFKKNNLPEELKKIL